MSDTLKKIFDPKAVWDIPGAVNANTVMPFPAKGGGAHKVIVPGGPAFIAIGDLPDREPDFLIDGLIETDCLASVFGDPGHGKSFFAIDMGLCVATGTSFHGMDVQRGSVFYIAGEGHNGLSRRTKAWAKHHDTTLGGVPLFASTKAANFLDAAHAEFVATQIDGLVAQHGEPRLIIIDTLARNFGDGDENSTSDMNTFVTAMDDLRGRYPNSTVLVVHHTGHGDKSRARGAMAFKGALDAEYLVAKSDGTVTVTCKKMKEGEEPAPIAFALKGVHLGVDKKGKDFGSAVLVLCDAPATKKDRLTGNNRLGLDTFMITASECGTEQSGAFRGVSLDNWRDKFYQKSPGDNIDTKRRTFNRARTWLCDNGYLQVNNDLYQVAAKADLDLDSIG